jgi:ADP-dependent NAD(P)H-hydrate dehydratase / NAD(P)H-hydrate epimerase
MLAACGCSVAREIPAAARNATLVIDALLGTGITGAASGRMLEAIREINTGFPLAKVAAVDIPSGMASDAGEPAGEFARADYTVTFTAPKPAHVLPPNCNHVGEWAVGAIGSPASLYEDTWLALIEPGMFRPLLALRPRGGHKGTFGHVLIVAGSRGKTGAAAMSGMGALRAGAGLVTVASAASAIAEIAAHAPELMTEPLEQTPAGSIARNAGLEKLAEGKTVVAMGPGLGREADIGILVARAVESLSQPMVLDADALAPEMPGAAGRVRVLTPHPGEMARLTGKTTAEVQENRVGTARSFAQSRGVTLLLKGERTVVAFPDGRVWINPTGTPAMGTGGTGDILTGMISGLLAQFPNQPDQAVAAAVYLHGLAGEIGARTVGEKSLVATDLLTYLPDAISFAATLAGSGEACGDVSHRV